MALLNCCVNFGVIVCVKFSMIDRIVEFSKAATSSSPVENRTVGDSNGKSHNLDYPPLPIISTPLNGNNWLAWSRAVRIALEGCDKLSFVDGTSIQPHEGAEAIKQWKFTDYMVLTWILNTISKEIVNAYLYAGSTRNLWLQLEARYGESNGPLQYQLQREINSMTQVMEPLPHVDKAFSMVMRVERQRKVHMETVETGMNNAMYARNGDQECIGYKTFYKDLIDKKQKEGNEGRVYMAAETEKNPETSTNSLIADLMEALKLVQNRSVTDPVKVHFAQFEEELTGMAFNTNHNRYVLGAWIVDTGAKRHMCGDVTLLHSLTRIDPNPIIHLPNGSVTKATHIGTAQPTDSIALAEDQRNEEVLAISNQIGKLFYLTPSSFSSTAVNKCTKSVLESVHFIQDCTSYELWHKRLGHPSENVIDHIPTLKCKQPKEQSVCSICHLAKQSRKSFPLSNSSADTLFALIHVDIWGPYKQSSLSGCHYVLTVVDDHSRTI
ncbi:UNVERIFIED_CONTAM: hypothetical protein Scaly_1188900 [Sesamum calycinum]|uniref:GAG-pre-integrase domain-containing protein n=1 Tax=Sesamum calycinum TaxID=2727403 RepID=A0AAW2Q3M8_9LAMI